MLRLENSWSENCPERSEHARWDRCPICTEGKTIPSCATGVEPAGDHQWWAVFFDKEEAKLMFNYLDSTEKKMHEQELFTFRKRYMVLNATGMSTTLLGLALIYLPRRRRDSILSVNDTVDPPVPPLDNVVSINRRRYR